MYIFGITANDINNNRINKEHFHVLSYTFNQAEWGGLSRQFPFKERSQQENNDQINKTLSLTPLSAES